MPQEDHGFVARIGDQTRVARCVMLASGVVDTVPPVPGIAEAIMRDLVRVCPICDGYEARGRRVAVLGAGDYAAREALFLRTFAFDVSLVLAPEGRLSGALATRLREVGVGVRRSSLAEITVGHAAVTTVDAQTGREASFDLLYPVFGVTAQSKLARGLDAALDETGRIKVDEHQQTSIPGVFAAGDVVRGLNQISVAMGQGAIAATAVHNRLPLAPA